MNGIHAATHFGAVLLALAAAVPAEAAIVIGDKEWLGIEPTIFESYNEVVGQLGPSGTYEGYMVADFDAIIDLLVTSGVLDSPESTTPNYAEARALMEGPIGWNFGCFDCELGFAVSAGWILNYETSEVSLFQLFVESTFFLDAEETPDSSFAVLGPVPPDALDFADPVRGGTWLYRPVATGVIPEPSSAVAWLLLGIVGASIVGIYRKRPTPEGI